MPPPRSHVPEFRIRVASLDAASDELAAQLPFAATYVRTLRAPDAGHYLLFRLDTPLAWKGAPRRHIIVGGHFQGGPVTPMGTEFVINLAIVTDPAVATSPAFTFDQADFGAIGRATNVSG